MVKGRAHDLDVAGERGLLEFRLHLVGDGVRLDGRGLIGDVHARNARNRADRNLR